MKKALVTVIIGLTAGLLTQSIYFNSFKPCDDNSLECQLSWIQEYLSLSDQQFEVVVAMHRDHQPKINRLENEIQNLENRLAALEEERIEKNQIDFIAFYSYLQRKVDLDKTRDSSTENFLTQVREVLNPEQKVRFANLLNEFKTSLREET
ncbi:MAG: hypothetical protein O3C43_20680 [Verrucomicrobia bacterium]|nr:hypothetical protein [Verrucomicrobiota bacterium]MDA1068909.1 hypothetical protein [Verrucomicrobiota bacterium]